MHAISDTELRPPSSFPVALWCGRCIRARRQPDVALAGTSQLHMLSDAPGEGSCRPIEHISSRMEHQHPPECRPIAKQPLPLPPPLPQLAAAAAAAAAAAVWSGRRLCRMAAQPACTCCSTPRQSTAGAHVHRYGRHSYGRQSRWRCTGGLDGRDIMMIRAAAAVCASRCGASVRACEQSNIRARRTSPAAAASA